MSEFRLGQLILASIIPTFEKDLKLVEDHRLVSGLDEFYECVKDRTPTHVTSPLRSDIIDFELREDLLLKLDLILSNQPSVRFVQLIELLAWMSRGAKYCVYNVGDRELRDSAERLLATLEGGFSQQTGGGGRS